MELIGRYGWYNSTWQRYFLWMKKIAKQAADEGGRISNYWGTRVNLISVDSKTCKYFGDDGMD